MTLGASQDPDLWPETTSPQLPFVRTGRKLLSKQTFWGVRV